MKPKPIGTWNGEPVTTATVLHHELGISPRMMSYYTKTGLLQRVSIPGFTQCYFISFSSAVALFERLQIRNRYKPKRRV